MKELTAGEKLALLKKEHGGLQSAIKKTSQYTYIVYDADGTIQYKGIAEPGADEYTDCKMYKFNTVDTAIIDENGKGPAQFYIEEDEHNVCHIKLRTIENVKIKKDRDFLNEVEVGDTDADFYISYTDTDWSITINATIPENNIVFYITPVGDPHILLERVLFPVANIEDNTIVVKRKIELKDEFSIYTHKNSKSISRKA